jgi:hypothetical protein
MNINDRAAETELSPLMELPKLRERLLSEIEVALKQGAKPNFFEAAERLRSGDALLSQVVSLWQGNNLTPVPPTNGLPSDYISAKERGERVRCDWVGSTLGKSVVQLKGTLYQNGRKETIGIAYAKEQTNRKNRWFLGLLENKFQSAVLLCESVEGTIHAFCLSREFISKYRHALSVSHGQVKFNVTKQGESWFLSLLGSEEIAITDTMNKVSLVV